MARSPHASTGEEAFRDFSVLAGPGKFEFSFMKRGNPCDLVRACKQRIYTSITGRGSYVKEMPDRLSTRSIQVSGDIRPRIATVQE